MIPTARERAYRRYFIAVVLFLLLVAYINGWIDTVINWVKDGVNWFAEKTGLSERTVVLIIIAILGGFVLFDYWRKPKFKF